MDKQEAWFTPCKQGDDVRTAGADKLAQKLRDWRQRHFRDPVDQSEYKRIKAMGSCYFSIFD